MENATGMQRASTSNPSYKASLTREQFLFYEMRTTAKLLASGMDDETVIFTITQDNLFQYPTERMIKRMAMLATISVAASRSFTRACIAALVYFLTGDMLLEEQLVVLPSELFRIENPYLHPEFLNFKTFFFTSFYQLHHGDVTIPPNGCRCFLYPIMPIFPNLGWKPPLFSPHMPGFRSANRRAAFHL